MWRYVIKRILRLIPTFIFVSFIVFWLMSLSGDPASVIAGMEATPEEIEALRETMGLNRPLIVRYVEYMADLIRGDMGTDIFGNNVWDQISVRFPNTLLLIVVAIAGSTLIAIPLGIIASLRKGTWTDTGVTTVSLFFNCMPVFWFGMMLQTLFAVKLGWLPTSGIEKGLAISLILPCATSILSQMAAKCRQTRSAMLDNLNADFVRTALAKGVPYKRAVLKHAFPNATIPIITVIGTSFATSVGGSVALETVFAWPGVGTLLIPAIRASNYPLVCGCVILLILLIGLVNLLIDIAYAFADPRIKARYIGK